MSLARVLLVLILLPAFADAALFKCKDRDGQLTYSDQPCAGQEVPMKKQGSFSSVNIPPRQFVPAYEESSAGGSVTSAGSSSRSSSSSSSSSGSSSSSSGGGGTHMGY